MKKWILIEIQDVKKRESKTLNFTVLTHMNTQFPVNLRPKTNASCDMGYFRVISTPEPVCGCHVVL